MTVVPVTGEVGSVIDPYLDHSSTSWTTNDAQVNRSLIYGMGADEPTPWQVNRVLSRDGVAAKLQKILTLPLKSVGYQISEAKGDTGEADLVRAVLGTPANGGGMSTPMTMVVAQMCSAVAYRFAAFEKVWAIAELDPGNPHPAPVYLDKLAFRPQTNTTIVRNRRGGTFQGLRQRLDPMVATAADRSGFVFIPAERSLVYIHGQDHNPTDGTSDLRIAWRCQEIAQRIEFLWLRFLSTRSLPQIVATGASDPEGVVKQLGALVNGGAVALGGDGIGIQVLNAAGAGGDQFVTALDWLHSLASGSVLAGFLDLTGSASAGRGSYALSNDQSDLFLDSRQGVLIEMASCLTNYLIADIIRYNMPGSRAMPVLNFEKPQTNKAIADLMGPIGQLAAARVTHAYPQEFTDEITEQLASTLGMNVSVIADALDNYTVPSAPSAQQPPVQQVLKSMSDSIDFANRELDRAGVPA